MIGYIEGKPLELKPNFIILLTNGIGFRIKISLNTYSAVSSHQLVSLYVHTYVREDRIELYGFTGKDDVSLFEMLIKVNGVGPNMALAIMSGLSTSEIVNAVRQRDHGQFVRIPGIGKTKAEKIILDMQNRISGFEDETGDLIEPVVLDAIESLVALGFDEKQASKTVYEIHDNNKEVGLEQLLRSSLKKIKK